MAKRGKPRTVPGAKSQHQEVSADFSVFVERECSGPELGLALNLSQREVRKFTAVGVFPPIKGGKFKLLQCLHIYIDRLRRSPKALSAVGDKDGKSRLTKARADMQEMKVRQLAGTLIDVEEFEKIFSAALSDVTTRLLAIPAKNAMKLNAAKSPAQVQAILYGEIEAALKEISEFELKPVARPDKHVLDDTEDMEEVGSSSETDD